jgi:methylated-DNA-[protein]-cysteine S-methyltransferase
MTDTCCTIESPIGRLHLVSNGDALTSLVIEGSVSPRAEGHMCSAKADRVLASASKQLGQYFAGKRTSFDVPVSFGGTQFQHEVWSALAQIPFGDSYTYGELGAHAGRPGSGRAVGGCVGRNPIAIIVPCHRVLGSDRKITGFSGGNGISTKEWLLEHEGISYRASAS